MKQRALCLSTHDALSGDVDGAFLHVVDPGQALAAAVGRAGVRMPLYDIPHLMAI